MKSAPDSCLRIETTVRVSEPKARASRTNRREEAAKSIIAVGNNSAVL